MRSGLMETPRPAPTLAIPFAIFAPLVIALALCAAYANSFSVPFLFDDNSSIVENETIRQCWPPGPAFSPPGEGKTVDGRPLLNYSFALNYAAGGENVRGYHAVNLLIHFLAALTLFGLVRRTLLSPALREEFGGDAGKLALLVALLWALHPLQTESVTYIAQRAESLVGLFYLLALYCIARATETRPALWVAFWGAGGVAACLTGAFCKEVIATAPLVALCWDRTFAAGSFRDALRKRGWLHGGMFATWLAVAWQMHQTSGRGGTAGLGMGVEAIRYAKIQAWVVFQYMKLAVWPHPLVFDYGRGMTIGWKVYALPGAATVLLFLLGLFAFWRRPAAGFCAAAFFIILGPTSSFIPVITEAAAEHRMYLPLAAVLSLAALGIYAMAGPQMRLRLPAAYCLWALALGAATHSRNAVYATEISIWEDSAKKMPSNPRAHFAAGLARFKIDQVPAALAHFDEALRRAPRYPEALVGRATCLVLLGRAAEALPIAREAMRLEPALFGAQYACGQALAALGRHEEAAARFAAALRLKPKSSDAEFLLGETLEQSGRPGEARAHYEAALRINPGNAEARKNLDALNGTAEDPAVGNE